MKVKDVKHKVTLDDFEHRLIVGCVNVARTRINTAVNDQNRLSRTRLKRQTWKLFILRSKMMKTSQRIFWSALKRSIQRSQRNQI